MRQISSSRDGTKLNRENEQGKSGKWIRMTVGEVGQIIQWTKTSLEAKKI